MTAAPPEHPRPARLAFDTLPSPIGDVLLFTDEAGYLRGLHWHGHEARYAAQLGRLYPHAPITPGSAPAAVRRPLADYFAGDLKQLARTPWRIRGTDFQRTAWTALFDIPPGETRSYADQTARIGRPGSVRAMGTANGSNPISLVLPCHRLIASNGDLTGYGGSLPRKQWLLRHEGAVGWTTMGLG